MAWRTNFKRMILAGRSREQKVQLLRRLVMESRRESQEMFLAVESERGIVKREECRQGYLVFEKGDVGLPREY